MEYYAIQVNARHENDYKLLLQSNIEKNVEIIVPTRSLMIRKHGKTLLEKRPVFQGYVFLGIINENDFEKIHWIARRTKYFLRFLPGNEIRQSLSGYDLGILSHFISYKENIDISKVQFDENDKIVVLEGPLKGLEGYIVKVDRRKCRAKIRLNMCGNSFIFDLSYNAVNSLSKETKS